MAQEDTINVKWAVGWVAGIIATVVSSVVIAIFSLFLASFFGNIEDGIKENKDSLKDRMTEAQIKHYVDLKFIPVEEKQKMFLKKLDSYIQSQHNDKVEVIKKLGKIDASLARIEANIEK